jgi:uncharacterized repeat protein (TIGR01451 family)
MTDPKPAVRFVLAAALGGMLAACAGTSGVTVPAAGNDPAAVRRPHATPSILASEGFSPSAIIQAGGDAALRITLTNATSIEVTQLHFTDTLPTGIYVVSGYTTAASSSCTGTTWATSGGQTFGFANVKLAPGASCSMTFEISGFSNGIYTNEIPAGSMIAPLTNTSPPSNVFAAPALKVDLPNHHP